MERKSSAYYQRLYRQRLREQGLVKKEVWILPEHAQALAAVERELRQPQYKGVFSDKESGMSVSQVWTVQALHAALSAADSFKDGRVSVELLQGTDASLHIVMREYGDLPLFAAVYGEQIVIEAVLWPVEDVRDPDAFNKEVLRTHKLFPLSSIGLQAMPDGQECYIMFGALSATSNLSNIVEEIETLADNVIKVTEAYEDLIAVSV